MTFTIIALGLHLFGQQAALDPRQEFLEANRELAFHLGTCAQYHKPGMRDRLVRGQARIEDPFRVMVLGVAIEAFDRAERERPSVVPTETECDELVGRAIARAALAEADLNGELPYRRTE